jgi:hemoglobin
MKHSKVDAANTYELVYSFYGHISNDQELGPTFNDVIMENWNLYLNTMVTFWTSVMLSNGLYKGTPMFKHVVIKNVTPAYFELWL